MPANSATITTRLVVRRNNVPQLIKFIQEQTRTAVDETAFDIQTDAAQMAPRDTGSLAASIYINNGDESDYTQRVAVAESLNRDVVILERIDPEFVISLSGGPDASYGSVVGVAAAHGIFQELGTRFQPPQPFMIGAAEVARDDFEARMSRVASI